MDNQIFQTLIDDLQNRKEYNLAYQLQKDLAISELLNHQKWEQQKKEIVDEVMSRIKINMSADTSAIDELIKKLDKLGK